LLFLSSRDQYPEDENIRVTFLSKREIGCKKKDRRDVEEQKK
jgi:hypothetical protein